MRCFWMGVGIIVSAACYAAPRYHATKLYEFGGAPFGIANDGAIGMGNSIYYQGQWTPMSDQSGYNIRATTSLRAHDIWSGSFSGGGVSYYKGETRVVLNPSSTETVSVVYTNANGDYVGCSSLPVDNIHFDQPTKTFLVHNGQTTVFGDYGGSAFWPTWLSDSGYVSLGLDIFPFSGQGSGWYVKPGSTTLTRANLLPTRIEENGDIVGVGGTGNGVYTQYSGGGFDVVSTPDGGISITNPDMNNHRQIVCEQRGTGSHPAIYWENKTSYYLDDLCDNASDLPSRSAGNWFSPHINDLGQIVAELPGQKIGGSQYNDLWRFDPIAVPEPSGLTASIVAAAFWTRRRRASNR